MSWPKDHKQATRQRIVEAAAAAFRERGVADVGVAEIMRRAGLTHGGFYAHFDSKDDLLAAALDQAATQVTSMLETAVKNRPGPDQLLNVALTYLSPPHLIHPESGCPVAALGPELVRSSDAADQPSRIGAPPLQYVRAIIARINGACLGHQTRAVRDRIATRS